MPDTQPRLEVVTSTVETPVYNCHILRKPGTDAEGKPNGEPFYVGRAKGTKCPGHYATHALNDHANNLRRNETIKSIWKTNQDFVFDVVLVTESETEVIAKQRELIASIGRDKLCNLTDGGKGVPNYASQRGDNVVRRSAAKDKFLAREGLTVVTSE